MQTQTRFIEQFLASGVPQALPLANLADWRQAHLAQAAAPLPVDAAIALACRVDRMAYAFASGYQAALRMLVPDIGPDCIAAFCVTEPDGNRPRHIRTRIEMTGDSARLNGHKSFITGAGLADLLLVAAREGEDEQGRSRIKLLAVKRDSKGVSIKEMPPLAFVPEISHAEASFEDTPVQAAQLLPGDGYADYVKPFRTVEDIHVAAAQLAYLYGVSRRCDWPVDVVEELVLALLNLRELASWPPASAHTHLLLAAHYARAADLMERVEACWPLAGEDERARWQRDKRLMGVASGAREQRADKARLALGLGSEAI